MKGFVESGEVITVAAPYDRSSGDGCLVGSLFGVCQSSATSGNNVDIKLEGVFDITALSTDTGTVGTKMYWDDTNKRLTTTSTSNRLVGVLTAAKGGTDTTARVYLDGAIR
jgi:predicted RecA/RadA family phage recombinase